MREFRRFGPPLLSIAIGGAVFFAALGIDFLIAQAPFFQTPHGDPAIEQSGYFYFLHDSWRLPLFLVPRFGEPEGAVVLYTGGVPILMVVGRLIANISGQYVNLLGFWYFISYVLQTHSFYWLMRQVTDREPWLLAVCSLLAVTAYAFVTRFGHIALCGQFLVIYAVGIVIALDRPRPNWKMLIAAGAGLVLISPLVFIYFTLAILPLFAAAVVQVVRRQRVALATAGMIAFATAILLISETWAAGYFWAVTRADMNDPTGYSALGLNLRGFFDPVGSPLFPHRPVIRSFWEGDFYLGIGVLALLAMHALVSPHYLVRALIRLWPLTVAFAMIAVYAISNRVSFGDSALFTYPLPWWMQAAAGQARVGGRVFWPIGYSIMGAAVVLTIIRLPAAYARVLLCVVVVLAAIESLYAFRFIRNAYAFAPATDILDREWLRKVYGSHARVRLYPSYWCGLHKHPFPAASFSGELHFEAAKQGLPINSAPTARKFKDCVREQAGAPTEVLRSGTLAIVTDAQILRGIFAGRQEEFFSRCRTFSFDRETSAICSELWTRSTALFPQVAIPEPTALAPALSPSGMIDFSENGNGSQYIVSGFWYPEGPATWALSPRASIVFTVVKQKEGATPTRLVVKLFPFVPSTANVRRIAVSLNGRRVAEWSYTSGSWVTETIILPEDLVGTAVVMTFDVNQAPTPKQSGMGEDPRPLGLALKGISVATD